MTAPRRRKLTDAEEAQVRARQNNRCTICGEVLSGRVERDHVISIWMGGPDDPANIEILHYACHRQVKCKSDAAARAKVKRLHRFRDEGRHRKRKGRKLEGRGFPKRPPQKTATRPIQKWAAWRDGF